jgi:hypothetical protein
MASKNTAHCIQKPISKKIQTPVDNVQLVLQNTTPGQLKLSIQNSGLLL